MSHKVDLPVHHFSKAKNCFSEVKFLSCDTSMNGKIITQLSEVCKSIEELHLIVKAKNNYDKIVKLIEGQKKLTKIHLLQLGISCCEIIENSIIKHANTIQHFMTNRKPMTKILSTFINLRVLELDDDIYVSSWDDIDNITLPFLQVLKLIVFQD
ncbi:hypothetical protein RclHR1_00950013 [Rhizophagus clarus]|uniref:Uncharacterized protein n=1 Tax=Rhizophagus clarus TaxID=94130 RepID=A0A2Z6S4W3_9GLOM|nr:hypothetical protein RclHR1_00950013 [Rhizophagus clarus]GES74665.1 hypothetical protein GLOIN_2v1777651 [Rhizophagus clarus]